MLNKPVKENKSKLIQIMNEVDDLTDEEKSFVLYWLKAKKNAQAAAQADSTIIQTISHLKIFIKSEIL